MKHFHTSLVRHFPKEFKKYVTVNDINVLQRDWPECGKYKSKIILEILRYGFGNQNKKALKNIPTSEKIYKDVIAMWQVYLSYKCILKYMEVPV